MIKKLLLMISVLALIVSPVFAFSLTSTDLSVSTCPSNTGLFVAQIMNTESTSSSYTLALTGSASGWASVAPSGLSLGPGQAQDVYIYVTPSTNAPSGTYSLRLTVTSGFSTRTLDFEYEVESCHDIALTAQTNELAVCSGSPAAYSLNLRNDGQWSDTYDLAVSGEARTWSSLSHNSISLDSGDSQQLAVTITPPRSEVGVYSLALAATSRNSGNVVAQSLAVISNSCYDYDMSASENYVSFCDNSEAKIPVTITNTGSENNIYSLDLDGTDWSVLDRDSVSVSAGSSATFNLVLTPGFNDVGTSTFRISSEAAQGDSTDSSIINANVLTCRDTSLDIESSSVELCPGSTETIDISLTNAGRFDENYALTVDGPSWAELSDNSIILASSESADLQLSLSPGTTASGSSRTVEVTARSQNVGNTQASDSTSVRVLSNSECYNLDVDSEYDEVVIAYGEGALIPVVVRNTGSQSAVFDFSVSGDGANMAQINPGSVEIDGNSAEEIYVYVSVPRDTAKESYMIYVAAQSGELRDTTAIQLSVSDEAPTFSIGLSGSEGGFITGLYSAASNFVVTYWYIFPALLVLLVVLYALGRVRESESWIKDLELLEQELEVSEKKTKPKPKRAQPSIFKRFYNWLMDEENVEIITKSKPVSTPKAKKKDGLWQRFVKWLDEEDTQKPKRRPKVKSRTVPKTQPNILVRAWDWLTEENEKVDIITSRPKSDKTLIEEVKEFLFEEIPVTGEPARRVSKPKPSQKGHWQKFVDWLMEEDKPKPKKPVRKVSPAKKSKKKDNLWTRFVNWLDEDDTPKTKPVRKARPKKVAPKKKTKKKDGLWQKFVNWLDEDDTPKSKPKPAPKPKPKKKEKGLWQKFIDWLEEED